MLDIINNQLISIGKIVHKGNVTLFIHFSCQNLKITAFIVTKVTLKNRFANRKLTNP